MMTGSNDSDDAIMTCDSQCENTGETLSRVSRGLLDQAFRAELERLSQMTPKLAACRRRPEKRRSQRRGEGRSAQGGKTGSVSKGSALYRFFTHLIRSRGSHALLLVVDASESMERPSEVTGVRKYDQARRLAAALGIVLGGRYDVVQLLAVGHARGARSPIFRSFPGATEKLFRSLKRLRPGGRARFVHVLQRLVKRLPMTTDCVIISDMLAPEWEPAFAMLVNEPRMHTSLIQIADPADSDESLSQIWLAHSAGSSGRPLDPEMDRQLRFLMKDETREAAGLMIPDTQDFVRLMTDEPFERALIAALEGK